MPPSPPSVPIADLRRRIRAIETGDLGRSRRLAVTREHAPLPWDGLSLGALHEVAGPAGAAAGFCATLAAGIADQNAASRNRDGTTVLWCLRHARLYGPGLAFFGLGPDRLLIARATTDNGILWAMEEGLRCRALAAVIGEVGAASFTASRRLQLAAAAQGVTAILLRPARAMAGTEASAARTRWRVSPSPSAAEGRPRWCLQRQRAREGLPGEWLMEWNDETGDFAVAADAGDRPVSARTTAGRAQAAQRRH